MHRSGSSLVSRIFHEFDVYMTPTPGVSDPANEEGEYENLEITDLNSTLLKENEGDWLNPVVVDKPDNRCKEIIDKYSRELWGWKDNRTVFTFKCYEPYLENVMFVITHRKKKAVIDSLMRTHKMLFPKEKRNREYMGDLYDRYYKQIDVVTKGYNRIDIHYEDLANTKYFNSDLKHF